MRRTVLWAAALVLLTRLPQLTSGMLPDGDEAVLGLMARHLAQGKALPLFFYGQNYGFSLLEAGTAAGLFALFGSSTAVLKLAMLLLWCLGGLFLVLSVRDYVSRSAAAIAALLLASCPAWFLWSMKARGGYISAFLLCHLTIWLTARLGGMPRGRGAVAALIGGNLILVYLCQPLWLAGLLPFLFLGLGRWTRRDYAWIGAGALAAAVAGVWLKARAGTYYDPGLFGYVDAGAGLAALPERVRTAFGGSYYLGRPVDSGWAVRAAGAVWAGLFVLAAAAAVWKIARRRISGFALCCLIGMTAPVLLSAVSDSPLFGYRYLLPAPGFLVMLLAREWADARGRRRSLLQAAGGLAVLSGLAAAPYFAGFPYDGGEGETALTQEAALGRLIDELEERGIGHVYCLDPSLQWNLMFASGERILARWKEPEDRCPGYPRAVDRALRAGRPAAIVGKRRQLAGVRENLREVAVCETAAYFFAPVEREAIVRALGFRGCE
ncbi:MAG: glycosyltransferase family 39 protein [Lentisphaerae bacterium]|nr:glycosyltransferase family 39 protein [Lentisphaerota bacterium]